MSLLIALAGGGPGDQTLTQTSTFTDTPDTFFGGQVNLELLAPFFDETPNTFFAGQANLVLFGTSYLDPDLFFGGTVLGGETGAGATSMYPRDRRRRRD